MARGEREQTKDSLTQDRKNGKTLLASRFKGSTGSGGFSGSGGFAPKCGTLLDSNKAIACDCEESTQRQEQSANPFNPPHPVEPLNPDAG
jgi:hypothetical protein